MRRTWVLMAATVVLAGGVALAEMVGVPGSSTTYISELHGNIGGKEVKLRLTGTAMRSKLIVNVYSVGSYVAEDCSVKTAESLAGVDVAKRLHLVMERSVEGKDLAEAFRAAVRMNYPEPAFVDEINSLMQYMRSMTARKGDNIYLTHVPSIGLRIDVSGKADMLIKNVAFSKAVWEIYLGKRSVSETIKKGLTSRL